MTEHGEVVLYDPSLFPELREQDPRRVNERFAQRFGQATSVDDLFSVLEGNNSQNMVGRALEITGVEWVPYMSDDGVIPNAICTAVDLETGEFTEFATTSMALTMFIRRAELLDAFPFRVKIAQKRTTNGRVALNFERA